MQAVLIAVKGNPVVVLQNLQGDIGVAAFVRLHQAAAALEGQRPDAGQQHQTEQGMVPDEFAHGSAFGMRPF